MKGLFERSRPRFWLYLAGPVLVGLVYGATESTSLVGLDVGFLLVYFLLPANVFLYGLNDIFDRDTDRVNPKKRGRERRYRGDRKTIFAVLASLGLGGAVFAVTPPESWPWFGAFFLLGVAYSMPPIRLKARPLLDSVSNGLYILPGVGAYVAVAGTIPPLVAIVSAWAWTMAMHTYSAIPDIEPDRMAGVSTTATWLGKRGAMAYCGVCWVGAMIGFLSLEWRLGLVMSIYPVVLGLIWWRSIAVDRAYWAFPLVNGIAGMVITLGGLWRLLYG